MQWFIIGRDMHVLCAPSTDLLQTLPIDDSSGGQQIEITNNCAVSTYDFTTDPRHQDSVYIIEGNYIAFRDKYGKDRLYTIMTIDGDEEWNVHCEDIGLDLINEYAVPWDYTARSIADTLSGVLFDSGWEIGINEVASYKRATKFEGTTDSQLTRIGNVCNQFDAECEFVIEMKGAKVTKQVINIYKTLGEDKTKQRFIDNINLISLSRSGSIEDLITCLQCYGKEDENGNKLTIANITYDDGRYYSPKGDIRIYDREARNKWSRFRAYDYAGQSEFDGYINGTFEYDTDNANELFNRGLTNLQSRNDVKVSYEASLYDLQADIGDSVQIADNRFQEKVYLSARIQSVRNHYTVSGQDTGVLANYKILTSNPTSDVTRIMNELKDQIVSVKSTQITYQIGASGVEAPTGVWLPDPPQTNPGQYLWTRKITIYTNNSQTTEYSVSRNGEDSTIQSDTEPEEKNHLWLNTSLNPPVLQQWNNEEWVIVNDVQGQFQSLRQEFNSEIDRTSETIKTEVSENYYSKEQADDLKKAISTQFEQTNDHFMFSFNEFSNNLDEFKQDTNDEFKNISKYIRFVDGKIILGMEENELECRIANDRISFFQNGVEVAYFTNNKFYVSDGEFTNSLTLGNFAFVPRENGNLSFKKVR